MASTPASIAAFLQGRRLAVAGVSRQPGQPANAIFRRLRETGHDVFPINPHASVVEGERRYHDVAAVPQPIDGVVIVTSPQASADVVRQCADAHVPRVWFHRSFGSGSVSDDAVPACAALGIEAIVRGVSPHVLRFSGRRAQMHALVAATVETSADVTRVVDERQSRLSRGTW